MSILHESWEQLQKAMSAMNAEIDREAKGEAKTVEPVNADGDSIADMRAVVKRLGKQSVEIMACSGSQRSLGQCDGHFNYGPNDYRITAKHSDTYDPACMDWVVWLGAITKRGRKPKCMGGIWTAITPEQYERERMESAWERMESRWATDSEASFVWEYSSQTRYRPYTTDGAQTWHDTTRKWQEFLGLDGEREITRTEAERIIACWAEPESVEREQAEPRPWDWMQPLFDLMQQEHGLTLLESEMHEIMQAVEIYVSERNKERDPLGLGDEFDAKPKPAQYVTERTHGINTVLDRKENPHRAICVCPHSKQDAHMIAKAMNAAAIAKAAK